MSGLSAIAELLVHSDRDLDGTLPWKLWTTSVEGGQNVQVKPHFLPGIKLPQNVILRRICVKFGHKTRIDVNPFGNELRYFSLRGSFTAKKTTFWAAFQWVSWLMLVSINVAVNKQVSCKDDDDDASSRHTCHTTTRLVVFFLNNIGYIWNKTHVACLTYMDIVT